MKSTEEAVTTFLKSINDFLSKPVNLGRFQKELSNENSRPYSWNLCYEWFSNNMSNLLDNNLSIDQKDKLYDQAALQLAFYLASFGMYRGGTLFLDFSYKIFKKPLQKALEKYRLLRTDLQTLDSGQIKISLKDSAHNGLSAEIIYLVGEEFKAYLVGEINKTKRSLPKSSHCNTKNKSITTLLQEKFILGVFGALPAKDEIVKSSLTRLGLDGKKYKLPNKDFTKENISIWLTFMQCYIDEVDNYPSIKALESLNKCPIARQIDTILWLYGQYSKSKTNKNKSKK